MMNSRTCEAALKGGPARRGFTLIEMGFVIGLLGLLGLLGSYVYIDGFEQEVAEVQDEGTVQDIYSIIDALRAYATGLEKSRNEFWPTFDDGCLHMRALIVHGFLRLGTPTANNSDAGGAFSGDICDTTTLEGPTRYVTCGTGRASSCIPYTLHRWNPRTRWHVDRYIYVRFGDSSRLENRRFEHGGNNFHLVLFFGFPGNYDDPDARARAQALADRLPNAEVRSSSFSNQMYIFVVLFYESSFIRGNTQYIRIDGEDRPVIFRPGRGVLGGIRQVAIDDAPEDTPPQPRTATPIPLNVGYPRIRMQPPDPPGRLDTELVLMADNTDQQDEAAVTFAHSSSSRVEFVVADRLASQTGSDVTVPHHSLTFGTLGHQARPRLYLQRRTSSRLSESGKVLQMVMRTRRPFDSTYDWDISLSSRRSHKPLRTRLCALERSTDDHNTDVLDPAVPPDVTCP